MLIARNIHKRIGSEEVLRGASITLHAGELVGLVGASGAGKTVLSRCLVGLSPWDLGTLTVDDDILINTADNEDAEGWFAVRRKVGLVAQNRALPPYRKVFDLVAEGPLFVANSNRHKALERASFWIERLGIQAHAHKYPTEISGGQLARVCLARALAMSPRYLICDELTSPLDPLTAAGVAQTLLGIVSSGVSVLMISHQLEFLRRYATRVDFLEAGRIEASGSPQDMLVNPSNKAMKAFVAGMELGR